MSDTIYFLLNERENAIKIGFSSQPGKRIAALSGGDRGQLTPLGFVSGTRAHEKELHRLLQEFRLNGEWFQASETVRRTVAEVIQHGISFLGVDLPADIPLEPVIQQARDVAGIIVKYSSAFSPDSVLERLVFLEKQYGFPPGVLWKMQYRPRTDLGTSKYFGLLSAAERFLTDALANISRDLEGVRGIIAENEESRLRVENTEKEMSRMEAELAGG